MTALPHSPADPTAATAAAATPRRTVRQVIFNILGFICVGAGIIGVFLPVWPTTGFVIAASILFAHANPRMYLWLRRNRFLGPYLANWYEKTGITMAYKIRTCVILWAGLGASMIFFVDAAWLYALLTVIGIGVTWHVFAIRTRKPDAA